MKILVDTNVLFSALLWPDSTPSKALWLAHSSNVIVLTDQNIQELNEIIQRKAPRYLKALHSFLEGFNYEFISTKNGPSSIRDETDAPILNAAIAHQVDIVLTGDKDFLSLNLTKPKCLSPSEYLSLYLKADK